MNSWPLYPVLYQINTWAWLTALTQQNGRQVTLGDVPEKELDSLADRRLDAVWLMGVWQRSPESRRIAQQLDSLVSDYRRLLSDYQPADVVGSPYAVYSYTVDPGLGGAAGLAEFRDRLKERGMRLVLDFVPNHLAVDHPWVQSHPERFVKGSEDDGRRQTQDYFTIASSTGHITFAHGRDPYFPSWTDTVQLDYRRLDTRQAMSETLLGIAEQCDGVRCDMAMLVNNDIFLGTWGGNLEHDLGGDQFWATAIRKAKSKRPDFLMIAEVYWDREYELQQFGFDYVYDKRLHERILQNNPIAITEHLANSSVDFQRHLLRFIENHDERRSFSVFVRDDRDLGPQRARAASTLALTLPGARLVQEGQMEGWQLKLPVQLGRRPTEPEDNSVLLHYKGLLRAISADVLHDGEWKLLNPHHVSDDNLSHRNIIAYQWLDGNERRIVVINLSAGRSQCYLRLDLPVTEGLPWTLRDQLSDIRYIRDGDRLANPGLYLDMPAYGHHLFQAQVAKLPSGLRLRCGFSEHNEPVYGIALSPDAEAMALAGESSKRIWLVRTSDCKVIRKLPGHERAVGCVAWSPDGETVASGSDDSTIRLWDSTQGTLRRTCHGHQHNVLTIAFSPDGRMLVSGGFDRQVIVWDTQTGEKIRVLGWHDDAVNSVAFSPDGKSIASASGDQTIRIWDSQSFDLRHVLKGEHWFSSIAWSPDSENIAAGTGGGTIEVWQAATARHSVIREGHTARVLSIAFGDSGRLLASKAADGTVRLWKSDTWEEVAVLEEEGLYLSGLAFHSQKPVLVSRDDAHNIIWVWDLQADALREAAPMSESVQYIAAKIALVGDQGVGKSGLGHRLAKGEFVPHDSTHGEQFWVVRDFSLRRADGAECEAVLWDFAGQPDYRLIHALFLDDVDLALIVFDASNLEQPLKGVEYWLQQLSRPKEKKKILVAQRVDRGGLTFEEKELERFCLKHGIGGRYALVSAKTGLGLPELKARIIEQIAWHEMTPRITTATFKRIKEHVLALKETSTNTAKQTKILLSHAELHAHLKREDPLFTCSENEIYKAVEHLASHGYVRVLRTSIGAASILLAPALLRNLASSFVLEARRSPQGLGALEEAKVLRGDYDFPELVHLRPEERKLLLDAVIVLFLEHNICFRETLGNQTYLVFPALINQKRPVTVQQDTVDDVSYIVTGSLENVYASLVVLLGYTNTFTRTNQWQNQAQYEVGPAEICGFRQVNEQEGSTEFVLFYAETTPPHTRSLFQGLFEKFLRNRDVKVLKYPPVLCPLKHVQERVTVIKKISEGFKSLYCSDCARLVVLPQVSGLAAKETAEVEQQTKIADDRTLYETGVARLKSLVRDVKPPSCFLSYAWGSGEHEHWVLTLATDLRNAGIDVLLDRWEQDIGSSLARFIERGAQCDYIAVIGTPSYRIKYENRDDQAGTVVAAEMHLVNLRMFGTENQKKTVLPLLREGEDETSLPPFLIGRTYADFRKDQVYFAKVFELLLKLYGLAPHELAMDLVDEWRRGADLLARTT